MSNLISYIGKNWMPLLMAFVPGSMVLAFMPTIPYQYYILLIICSVIALINIKRTNVAFLVLVASVTLSTFQSQAPSYFRIWERLGLFLLLLGVVTPLFESEFMYKIRKQTFIYLCYICTFIGVMSFPCYVLGINYSYNVWTESYDFEEGSVGGFGGLTPHSMLLGPCAAIGLVCLGYMLILYPNRRRILNLSERYYRVLLLAMMVASFCCILVSASRGSLIAAAGGLIVLIVIKYKGRITKALSSIIIIILLLGCAYPIYSGFSQGLEQKQESNMNSGGTFSSRENLWENRWQEFKDNPIFGVGICTVDTRFSEEFNLGGGIEPGSSWLAILSMTGIIGGIAILSILVPTTLKLYKKSITTGGISALYLAVLVLLYIHMMVEGYIYSAGSILCYILWLTLGIASSYTSRLS